MSMFHLQCHVLPVYLYFNIVYLLIFEKEKCLLLPRSELLTFSFQCKPTITISLLLTLAVDGLTVNKLTPSSNRSKVFAAFATLFG